MQTQPDLEEMASTLATQGIESNELALDLILHDLAEQARQATDASGAAIALQRDRSMVCRAAAGAVAPDLGVAINTESGLTGACVREQKTQWCSDTETDPRVDAEACRALGVRSIVVVPVFRRDSLVGVLEIFSSEPEAFREHHLTTLQGLAQWVTEAMQSAAGKTAVRQVADPAVEATPVGTTERAGRRVAEVVPISESAALEPPPADKETKILRAVVVGLAIVLCVMLGIHWGWKRTTVSEAARIVPVTNSNTGQASTAQQPQEITLQGPVSAKPAPSKPNSPAEKDSLVVYKDDVVVFQQKPEGTDKSQSATAESGKSKNTPPASDAQVDDTPNTGTGELKADVAAPEPPPPQITTTAGLLAIVPPGIAAAPVAPGVRISQGLTEGKLIHRVNPLYPSQALQRRIDGQVVILAQVGKDGRVHNPKAIRGNALLVSAALDAVRQWAYEPYRLNGEAVDMDTQITINFKLP